MPTTHPDTGLETVPFLTAKTDQAVEVLKEKGIDVWLTYVRETVANVDPSLELIFEGDLTWESALILTADGEKVAIVGVHDAPDIEEAGIYGRVIGYREGITEPLLNTLNRLDPHSIAINVSENDSLADGLGAGLQKLLERRLKDTVFEDRLVPAEDVIWSLRGRKLPMEVEAIAHCVQETQKIFDEATSLIRPGLTAAQFADAIRGLAHDKGYGCAWTPKMCPIVTTGSSQRVGHVAPTQDVISPGSLVHVDFGIRHQQYCSDMQRMWWVADGDQPVPEEVLKAYATIVSAIEKAAAELRPGVAGWEVDQIARDELTANGFEEYTHALGHQLGRSPHDGGGATLAPRWERYNETPYRPVEKGNVFTLEPSILLPDHGMVALEENVLVTEDGCEFLSVLPRELPVLKVD
ncbi:MAG: aminopeptidase P family protein [Gemmatimonadetes bacterium]|nr:aminopeptidase P family protein [Gemmatimonadota bacterium]